LVAAGQFLQLEQRHHFLQFQPLAVARVLTEALAVMAVLVAVRVNFKMLLAALQHLVKVLMAARLLQAITPVVVEGLAR
jgi:hypothetical protein